jgi:hypothetical protein
MSVNSHLVDTAAKLIITDKEREIIDGHVVALNNKLNSYFNAGSISEKFAFGSYTRKTLMPRKADDNSDVDFMVVFSDNKYKPDTYLSWLKGFANDKYKSETYQDHPTIVLELSKIKLELVPAIKSAYDDYQIPAPASNYADWLNTHPTAFGTQVTNKNTNEKSMIRRMIRLMKYWNGQNGRVYSSFELENLIVGHFYGNCQTLWDYVHSFVSGLSAYGKAQYKADKITRLKDICTKAKSLEQGSYWVPADSTGAETEIKKAFPIY